MGKILYITLAFIMAISTNICSAMSMSCNFNEIGYISWPPDDGFYNDGWKFKGFNVINGDKFNCTARIQNDIYAHCIERKGSGKYDRFVTVGDINKNNVVRLSNDYAVRDYTFYKINNTLNQDMFLILKRTSFIANNMVQLIARNKDGRWFSYFDTLNTMEAYGHRAMNTNVLKELVIENDYIILKYRTINNYKINGKYTSKDGYYEIVYKWDEAANWFSVSHKIVGESDPPTKYTKEYYQIKGYSNERYTVLTNN